MTPDQERKLNAIYEALFNGSHTARREYPALLEIEVETQRRVSASLEVAKAQAAKGSPLTADEVEAASERGAAKALDSKITGATVVLEAAPDPGSK